MKEGAAGKSFRTEYVREIFRILSEWIGPTAMSRVKRLDGLIGGQSCFRHPPQARSYCSRKLRVRPCKTPHLQFLELEPKRFLPPMFDKGFTLEQLTRLAHGKRCHYGFRVRGISGCELSKRHRLPRHQYRSEPDRLAIA